MCSEDSFVSQVTAVTIVCTKLAVRLTNLNVTRAVRSGPEANVGVPRVCETKASN